MHNVKDLYLHPFSLSSLNAPATILDNRIPMVMNSWLSDTSAPRMEGGDASATYIGIDMDAKPEQIKEN